MPQPEARTTGNSKRARSRKDEQPGDCIVVSFKSMEDRVQATRGGEHPNRSPASEAARPTSQLDGVDCQSNRQVSNEVSNTMQKAGLALLAVEASRWTKPSQDNTPPDSRIESNSASTDSPKSDSRPLEITEIDNTGLSGQVRNPPNDAQPPPPPVSSPHDSQGPSDLHVPASSERQSFSSAPVESEQDPGRSWNPHRVGTQRSSAVETERRPSVSRPFGASSTVGTSRSASVDNLPRPPNSTHRPETFNNNELRTTFRSSDPRPLQSMAQHISPTDFSRASPHVPNQASMQDARSRLFQPQMITTDPARGNRPSDSLNASQHLESVENPAGSKIVSISSSNATTAAAHHHQAPPHSQASSYRPALTFTIDNCLRGNLPLAAMQPYIEKFARNGHVFLRPKKEPNEHKVYPVGAIMWPRPPDFHRWYTAETGATDVSDLRVELYNAKLKLEKIFFVSRGNAHHFSMLRQYIWDFFWVASSLNNASTFKVAVRAVDHLPSGVFPHDPVTSTTMDVTTYVPRQHQPEDARGLSSRHTAIAALLDPEIVIRVQTDGAGKVSTRHSKWVLRPEITTTDFFAWFAHQTGRGGSEGPPSLRFTFKDAMPTPTSSTIAQANEDHFDLMKRDLKTQFEKAREFVPNLKEFLVVVTDPGWVSEEEYW
jgi:hypothetical protein